MKILTWNVERVKKQNLKTLIDQYGADIIVLTETSSKLDFSDKYKNIATEKLYQGYEGINYRNDENRTTIWTKYEIIEQISTFDNFTSVCCELKTEYGNLKIYATIIGVLGGKGERFKNDLESHLNDFNKFGVNENNCVVGDLNTNFAGFAYPSHHARNILNMTFKNLKMINLTAEIENNVDHIVLSEKFLENRKVQTEVWNFDKKLSDHIGICITIE